jgi:hypothetical protein
MACPDMTTEEAFLEVLRNFDNSRIENGHLLLLRGTGPSTSLAHLAAAPMP